MQTKRLTLLLSLCLVTAVNAEPRITLNDTRTFTVTDATEVKVDGTPVPFLRERIGTGGGYRLRLVAGSDVSQDFTSGTALLLEFENALIGPVTSVEPFEVFSQPLTLNADVAWVGLSGPQDLVSGETLHVSGFIDRNLGTGLGSFVVSRVERMAEPATFWKLSGYAAGVTANSLSIGSQSVDFTGVAPTACTVPLADGQYVEIKAAPVPTFPAGTTLDGVTEVECDTPEIEGPPGETGPGHMEGVVTAVDTDINDVLLGFTLSDQVVTVDASTEYLNGEADDVDEGMRLEVEGVLDTDTAVLAANKVKFRWPRVEFEGVAAAADVVAGTSVTMFGQTLGFSAQTRDDDGIAAGGIAQDTQLRVRGYEDSDGTLVVTRIVDRGNPDPQDVGVQGRVMAFDGGARTLTVQGVQVDATAAVFFDTLGQPISAQDFFAAVAIDSQVEVEDATATGAASMSAGLVSLVDPLLDDNNAAPKARLGATFGFGIGTVTAIAPEDIFTDSFDPAAR